MARWFGRWVGASLVVWIGLGGVAMGGGVADFMTADGGLRDELRVRDGQQGVVGQTGTLWVIAPSGAFTVSSFVNQTIGPPERVGSLTGEQLELVATSLASQDFGQLPRQIGTGAAANPRVISVIFGEDGATLTLSGPPIELERLVAAEAPRGGPEGRLLTVVGTILEVTAAD